MSASLARATWFFVENLSEQSMSPAPETVQSRQSSASESRDAVNLASLDLFGRAAEDSTQVVDAPETRLNLELQGVFTEEGRKNSTAIVAEGNKTGELYHLGDRLPGNATLEEVFDNYILIKRGNKMEKLMFEDSPFRGESGRSSSGPSSRPSAQQDSRQSALDQVRSRIADNSAEINMEEDLPTVDSFREQLEHYQQRLDEDPEEVMNELGIQSVDAGNAKGYEVGGDVSNVALQRVGLQQGDVILSVNGQPVGDVANDKALINEAVNAGSVRVEVQRGSRRFYLSVPIPEQ